MSCVICTIAVVIFMTGVLIKLFVKLSTEWCHAQTCLVGKTVIVTGGNTGIGFQTAIDFAKRGARVIIACRNKARGEDARSQIIEATGNNNVVVKIINLESFKSVRIFAKEINDTEERLDILVNNAGIICTEDRQSEDGHQVIMQVNYFSPFLLTLLLIDLMLKTENSRIVNVSSYAATFAKDFDVASLDKTTGRVYVYFYSKLCNILFTIELAKRLARTSVTTYSLHPGPVKTEITRNLTGVIKYVFAIVAAVFYKTCEEGAQTTIYCSVAKGIEKYSGGHFDNCFKVQTYKNANITGLPAAVWNATIDIVELKPNEINF